MNAEWTIKTIEKYCVLTEDVNAGKPVVLLDWQKSLIRSMVDHRIIWLEIARKNGKSATIAMIAIAHMLAGYKNKTNPQVILAAATREQATILLNYCKNTIYFTAGRVDPITKKSLDLSAILKPFRGEIRIKGLPGFLRLLPQMVAVIMV